ncbi:transposase [Planctomycetota bacterium]
MLTGKMNMSNTKTGKIRLNPEQYQGQVRVSYTLCVKNRSHLFTEANIVPLLLDELKLALLKYSCKNELYVFMPDHLHCMVEGEKSDSDSLKAMYVFKQKTGFWLAQNLPEHKWQSRFYDHIHRETESMRSHMLYILNNPIRKGLAADWIDYPYLGSLDYEIADLL